MKKCWPSGARSLGADLSRRAPLLSFGLIRCSCLHHPEVSDLCPSSARTSRLPRSSSTLVSSVLLALLWAPRRWGCRPLVERHPGVPWRSSFKRAIRSSAGDPRLRADVSPAPWGAAAGGIPSSPRSIFPRAPWQRAFDASSWGSPSRARGPVALGGAARPACSDITGRYPGRNRRAAGL